MWWKCLSSHWIAFLCALQKERVGNESRIKGIVGKGTGLLCCDENHTMTLSFSRTQQLMQLLLLMVHSWCVEKGEREREEGREEKTDQTVFSCNSVGMMSLSRVYLFQWLLSVVYISTSVSNQLWLNHSLNRLVQTDSFISVNKRFAHDQNKFYYPLLKSAKMGVEIFFTQKWLLNFTNSKIEMASNTLNALET